MSDGPPGLVSGSGAVGHRYFAGRTRRARPPGAPGGTGDWLGGSGSFHTEGITSSARRGSGIRTYTRRRAGILRPAA